jgi:hypothetical protein
MLGPPSAAFWQGNTVKVLYIDLGPESTEICKRFQASWQTTQSDRLPHWLTVLGGLAALQPGDAGVEDREGFGAIRDSFGAGVQIGHDLAVDAGLGQQNIEFRAAFFHFVLLLAALFLGVFALLRFEANFGFARFGS